MMSVAETIKEIIEKDLKPEVLELVNESRKHAGHAGDDGSGESHFKLMVVSKLFQGKSRIERNRMVLDLLYNKNSLKIHALSLILRTPDENNLK